MSDKSLQNKIVLVTGASRGIGQAIATQLACAGATVIGTATTEAGANKISEHANAEKLAVHGRVLNVAAPESITQLLSDIKADFAPINILINNAAITRDNLMMRMKEDEWTSVIETDLTAIFRLAKACLRDMLKAHWGRIINIGSVVGTTGNPGQANYCAAKAGVLGLTKSLALEVGSRNITVNTIAPGFISTDMTAVLTGEQKQVILDRIPLQRAGTPDDIANAVLFLASDKGSYITGQTLHINGGMYMP